MNAVLFDAWCQCEEGNWAQSKFYMDIRTRHTQKRKGIRRWLLPHEMDERFTPAVAQAMREHKGTKEELWEKETRFHPELPQKEDCNMVYVF